MSDRHTEASDDLHRSGSPAGTTARHAGCDIRPGGWCVTHQRHFSQACDPRPRPATNWATAYHETVDDLRRELASECETFRRRKDLHRGAAFPPRAGAEPADAERDAYLGCLMAGTYAYTLAAVLRVAGEEFGQETAARLASVADDILTNGDDHDRNADVRPADAEASHA